MEPNNPTRDQRKMYSETPHGTGALGLSELQGRALCLGEPQSQESLQGLQHHHLGVTGHMGENVKEGIDEEKVVEHPKRSGKYGAEMAGNKTADTEDFWNS